MSTHYNTGKHRWTHGAPVYGDGIVVRRLLGPCPSCGSVTSDYGGMYSCHNDYCKNSSDNFACQPEPIPDWWNTDIQVFIDGDAWCAVGAGYVNLQESKAGFGETPKAAVNDLRRIAS